ncbi:MAG TPA: glycosyltransferase family 39 protein, partial [Chloroflexota bacterium]|nr:glycosyltransferase family 39 protein [Chloroflexota bacterium]
MSTVRYRTQLLWLTLTAYALRVYGLDRQSFWLDEVDAIAMAAAPVSTHLRKLTAVGENGPLYFLLFKVWVQLAGPGEFGARAFSAFTSTLAIPLIAALAQALFHRRDIAVIAAALAAASPFYVWFGQDAKMYPLFAALTLGAQWCLVKAFECTSPMPEGQLWRRRGSWPWWLGYVLCSSFALYVHIFAALQIAANTLAGVALWLSRRQRGRALLLSTLLLTAPYVPLAVWQGPVLLRGANVGYRPVDLSAIVVTLLHQFTWHLNASVSRWWLVALVLVLAFGFWRIARGRYSHTDGDRRWAAWEPVAVLALWLAVPIALVYAVQF